MSANNRASNGPGPHHGRSASDEPIPIPSAVQNTPRNRPYNDDGRPNTHPRQRQRGLFCGNRPPIPSFGADPAPQLGPSYNSPRPQANQFYNADTIFTSPLAVEAYSAGLHYKPTVSTQGKHWYFCIQIRVPPPSIMDVRNDMTPRQRAEARLQQLTVSKRSINEQRGFIRSSIEDMEARLEALQHLNHDPAEPNTKLSELYAVEAALEKAEGDMNELARLWDQHELEYDEIMNAIADEKL